MSRLLVWYAAYGSNLDRDRFGAYLHGGRPDGAARTYPGARDRRPPRDERPLRIPGQVHFAWESPTWGGGIAFYDPVPREPGRREPAPRAPGAPAPEEPGPPQQTTALARAYLLTAGQFSDVAAQEMHRTPGADLDLRTLLRDGAHALGPGRYETLLRVGTLEDRPVLTFTAPVGHGLTANPPSAAYLALVGRGLAQAHALSPEEATAYLLACPGVRPHWSGPAILTLLQATGASSG